MTSAISTMSNIQLLAITPMIKKIFVIFLGGVTTILLFYMMYMLIKNDSIPDVVTPTPPIPEISYKPPVLKTLPPEEKLPVKPFEQVTPVVPYDPIKPVMDNPPAVVIKEPIDSKKAKRFNPISISSQPIPMVKITPEYPQTAAMRKIQGYVDVIFDVTETGATENIQIVYAEPEKIFNSAVLKAVARWKYKPKMEEGTTTKMYGVRERIRFNLEK